MPADAAEIVRLATLVEQATGPDRELDYEIHEWLHGEWLRRNAYIREPGDDGWYSATPPVKGGHSIAAPQSYTASLDAAVTLVPDGLRWCVDTCDDKPRSFVEPLHPYEGQPFWGNGATPALALTAAALRARAAQHDHEVG